MTHSTPEQQAEELRRTLNYHSYRYYVLSDPLITDSEYDTLYRELVALEAAHPHLITPDSPTQRAGADLSDDFAKITHPAPILSLANAYNNDDLTSWEERNLKLLPEGTTFEYTLEPKLDGLTIVITYENGVLQTAATRGNGEIGDDVTANVRTVNSVPLRIPINKDAPPAPDRLVVRGEILFRLADFEALNHEKITAGEPPFINPRNAASGTLKQKNSRIAASRPLSVYFYDVVTSEGKTWPTRWKMLQDLRAWGFPIAPNIQHYPTLSHVIQQIPTWAAQRKQLDYEIDGLVVKVNDTRTYRELGIVGKDPRGAIAYKYPAEEVTTVLLGVSEGVGRTGRIVPTAQLEPIAVGGVTVSNATLHNYDFVAEHDIRIHDRVRIKRAGDVIPYVIGPVPGSRSGIERAINPPKTCPACSTPVIKREDEGVDYYCPNADCPERVFRQLEFFVSRGALDIEGLGTQTIKVLLDEGLIVDEGDIFTLQAGQLLPLERFGEKKVENLLRAIDTAKHRPFAQILTALGISGVGGTVATLLARHFPSFEALTHADAEAFEAIDGIGPVIARQLVIWFAEPHNQRVLAKLKAAGVRQEAEVQTDTSDLFAGLTFVLTGTLPTMTRDEAKALIEQHSGKVTSSVSKKTRYVVAGESAGSKLEKAQKWEIPVLSEADLLAVIKQGGFTDKQESDEK